jgi:hypothetical protein
MSTKTRINAYKKEFLGLGFRRVVIDGQDRPQCLVCKVILSNSSMRTFNLRRHKEDKHQKLIDADENYFKNLLGDGEITNYDDIRAVRKASYEISYIIAKDGRPHTIGETTIKKSLIKFCESCSDPRTLDLAKKIPLSDSTIKNRIVTIAQNLEMSVISLLKDANYFSLQCDESTDVADEAQLAVFVKFFNNGDVTEELLFCRPIGITTTGQTIFE